MRDVFIVLINIVDAVLAVALMLVMAAAVCAIPFACAASCGLASRGYEIGAGR